MYKASHFRNLFFLISLVCHGAVAESADNHTIVVEGVGFATPESVEYYAEEDVYLVTNINGSPFDADGNGFISKLRPDGSVVELKWIDGTRQGTTLNAPKGMAIVDDKLYVADRNQVHIFTLPSGTQQASITIEGSTFLNGVTPACGGYVYVTDSGYGEGFSASGSDAIYKVRPSGHYKKVITDRDLGHPNGILEHGSYLTLVSFGSGELLSVDLAGRVSTLPAPANGNLDGLVALDDGQLAISSWGGSAIYLYNPDGTYSTLVESLDAPADLGVDSKRRRLLIPLFKQDKVVIQPY